MDFTESSHLRQSEIERKAHKATVRREWRSTKRRIDFYVEPSAYSVLASALVSSVGCDFSSKLNYIVRDWAARFSGK